MAERYGSPGMMYFPTKWGAKELQKPQNHSGISRLKVQWLNGPWLWNRTSPIIPGEMFTPQNSPVVHKRSCHLRLGLKDFFEKIAQEIPLTLIVVGGADMVLLATVEGVFTYWAPPYIYICLHVCIYVYIHTLQFVSHSPIQNPTKKREGIYYLIINRFFWDKKQTDQPQIGVNTSTSPSPD